MEFNYLPFGLSTADSTFQRAMNKVLGHLKFVTNYFDDVLIFSETIEPYKRNLTNIGESKSHSKTMKMPRMMPRSLFLGTLCGKRRY